MSDQPNRDSLSADLTYRAALSEAWTHAADGLLLSTSDDVVVYANDAAAVLLGPELVGQDLGNLAGGFLVTATHAEMQSAAPGTGDLWGILQLGERHIEVYSRGFDQQGSRCTLTTLKDATSRIKTERSLRARIAFENLVISVAAGFITLAPDQVDEAIDNTLARIGRAAGVDRAYVYLLNENQMTLSNVWAGEDSASRWKHLALPLSGVEDKLDRLRQNEPVVYEITETRLDGGKRLRSSVCVPMLQGDELTGFVGFDALWEAGSWRDEIVQLLKLVGFVFASTFARRSAQLREYAAHASLEQKVIDRTNELRAKQSELASSEKLASLGQLVAGVAHEVNTPLGAMKSNNDVLIRVLERIDTTPLSARDATLLATARQTLKVSREAVERIERIVASLRQFARLDQAERDTVDLHQGLESTLILIQHELKHRVRLERDYGQLPKIECYPNRLNQVFMNLLINASQAIDEKGEISIRTRTEGDQVVIEFRDTGSGIAAGDLKRIFDPGFTTKGVGVGTGLGLSIVRQIVTEHGGSIDVSSQRGTGTTFRVKLPQKLPNKARDSDLK